jgi:hypothetical protein
MTFEDNSEAINCMDKNEAYIRENVLLTRWNI